MCHLEYETECVCNNKKCREGPLKEECETQYTAECKVEVIQHGMTDHVKESQVGYETECDVKVDDKECWTGLS